MAHPIQRARQALRNAELQAESAEDVDGDIEAGLGEAVPPASGTEADLPPMHQRIHDMTSSGQIGKGNNSKPVDQRPNLHRTKPASKIWRLHYALRMWHVCLGSAVRHASM